MLQHQVPAQYLHMAAIEKELHALDEKWRELRDGLDGMSGSPGEWMVERMAELEGEMKRRFDGGALQTAIPMQSK